MGGWYAISVRQPWAALLAAGVKTVEVRTWPTRRRGPVLIHAARLPDPRPEGWACVTTRALAAAAELRQGIIGAAELVGCVEYDTPERFAADADRHRNAPGWFRPPRVYGLVLAAARPVAFYNIPGNTGFFRVENYPPAGGG
jgi:hypothetical protein